MVTPDILTFNSAQDNGIISFNRKVILTPGNSNKVVFYFKYPGNNAILFRVRCLVTSLWHNCG